MDESGLEASIATYKSQLDQVEAALQAAGEESNGDLVKLRTDLKQLIELTEASLLSFKKSKLLSIIDNGSKDDVHSTANASSGMDAEYAAFQASIFDEPSQSTSAGLNSDMYSDVTKTTKMPAEEQSHTGDSELQDISGTKCCVPYTHEWGEASHHNAMIVGVENLADDSEPQVRVLFSHPTHQSMIPCPYYLEGNCRFDDMNCRFSHGYVVNVSDLQEFKEPDYTLLGIDKKCLAKTEKNTWQQARVVDILENDMYQVMFDQTHQMSAVSVEEIYPQRERDSSDSESEADLGSRESSPVRGDSEDSEDELPVYLWRPGQSTEEMGSWEIHTRGIGSTLMQKMGYITGQGLGKNSDGRVESVPIQLLPSGKSLDKIMELKEIAGDRDLYDVMKKKKKKQKKTNENAAKTYTNIQPASVFDFINKKLGKHKKGQLKSLAKASNTKKSQTVKHISHRDLKEKSDKSLNIQLIQTHDEMNKVHKEISKLKVSLARNEGRDPGMTKQIQTKLAEMNRYLSQLKQSDASIQKHKKGRNDHKKLTIF